MNANEIKLLAKAKDICSSLNDILVDWDGFDSEMGKCEALWNVSERIAPVVDAYLEDPDVAGWDVPSALNKAHLKIHRAVEDHVKARSNGLYAIISNEHAALHHKLMRAS